MVGEENLIPFNQRTEEEQRELAKKGGIASGKARRRKATIRKTLETIMEMDVPDDNNRAILEALGLEPTMQNAVVIKTVMSAITDASPKSLDTLNKLLGQDKSLQDKREQTERIKRLRAETERLEHEMAVKTGEAGKEEIEAQVLSIADLINTPSQDRDIKDFLYSSDNGDEVINNG